MAGTQRFEAPIDADPDITPEEAPPGAPQSIEAAQPDHSTPPPPSSSPQAPHMAGAEGPKAPTDADPCIPQKKASSLAPDESIEAARRLQRIRANLRLPDRPFAAPSADYEAGLRALCLLDFVRLDLPSSGVPRPDLVAELLANYSSSRGWSSVRGKQVEVSFKSFARALCLPPYGTPAGSVADRAARTSASAEFTKIYFGAPAEASTDVKRRLPAIFWVKNVNRGPEYITDLLWELVKQEMEHLIESESTDWVSYYTAFLQRLIWVESPELFQLPPEPSVAVSSAALCVQKEQGSNQATTFENQKHCSKSDNPRAEASSEQIDMAFKKTDSRAGKKQKHCSEFHLQEIEARSKKIDTTSSIIDAEDKKFDVACKMIETISKQHGARAKQLGEQEGKLDARAKQLGEKEGKLTLDRMFMPMMPQLLSNNPPVAVSSIPLSTIVLSKRSWAVDSEQSVSFNSVQEASILKMVPPLRRSAARSLCFSDESTSVVPANVSLLPPVFAATPVSSHLKKRRGRAQKQDTLLVDTSVVPANDSLLPPVFAATPVPSPLKKRRGRAKNPVNSDQEKAKKRARLDMQEKPKKRAKKPVNSDQEKRRGRPKKQDTPLVDTSVVPANDSLLPPAATPISSPLKKRRGQAKKPVNSGQERPKKHARVDVQEKPKKRAKKKVNSDQEKRRGCPKKKDTPLVDTSVVPASDSLLPPVFAATPVSSPLEKRRGSAKKQDTPLVDTSVHRCTRSMVKNDGYRPKPVTSEQEKPKKRARVQSNKSGKQNIQPQVDDVQPQVDDEAEVPPETPLHVLQSVGINLGIDPAKLTKEKLEAVPEPCNKAMISHD